MRSYVDTQFKQIETHLQKFDKESKEESENIKKNIKMIKDYVDVSNSFLIKDRITQYAQ